MIKTSFNCILFTLLMCNLAVAVAADTSLKSRPQWQNDNTQQLWGPWNSSCQAFIKKKEQPWFNLCTKSDQIDSNNSTAVREFFENNFTLAPIINNDGSTEGTITGYYEPVLKGSLQPHNEYRYPVYSKPNQADLQSLSRQQIQSNADKFSQYIELWTDSPIDLFFLHVQGSGRVEFKNGEQKSLVYAGNNGHDYTSIGKVLINQNEISSSSMSLQTLKSWLTNHPQDISDVFNQNKRFIFFKLIDSPASESGPRGSLNVPLTPQRSIAIDPAFIKMGSPIWLETTLPNNNEQDTLFARLMFAQDTGAAIKGHVRADIFFGQGQEAEFLAGNMNQMGQMFQLVPK